MYKNPLQAYQEADKSGMSGREIEAYALTKAAMALKECQEKWETPELNQLLENALKLNQRVWSIFQAELTRADNPMPQPIKQNILKLGAFIDKQQLNFLAEPNPEALSILISINENLAAGLRETVENQEDLDDTSETNENQDLKQQISQFTQTG